MAATIEAWFDGTVFRPSEPIVLAPNTRVRITVETVAMGPERSTSFLQVARGLQLDGPPDWSANVEHYLYGADELDEA